VSASNPAAPEPTHIGKFEIVQTLGKGAMGTVYKAKDPGLDRDVAIKTIRLESLAASQQSLDDLVARFSREARVAAKLKHPNIVTIHEIGSLPGGNSYLVMEFVDGVGLDRVIKGSGKMSVERAAAIGAQVADALAYAHKHHVVHRDIKPANIMIEPGDHVKVADFGIAKLVTAETVDNLTATGSLLGTPSYMSPEQARGGKIDGRSDLFSVGCILYEMVCGQRAFRGESITALLFKIITEEPPPLREVDPTVSEEMVRIIAKALAKDPEGRYQTGRELADDLLAITRPGFVPTLRARDTPTLPPDAPPGDIPTLASPPTAQALPTISSAATAARPTASPALAPTILTPPTVPGGPPPLPPPVPPLPPKAAVPPTPARAPRTPAAAPVARKGGGAGLLVGLGLFGLLLVALVVGGGLYLMRRNAPAPSVAGTSASAQPPASTEPASSGTQPPAEAAPAAAATTAPPPAPLPETRPGAGAIPGGAKTAQARPPAQPAPPPSDAGSASSPTRAEPSAGEFTHLNELPPEETDGRATGDALAQKYRSGGTSSYTTGRYGRRSRVPRGVTMPERPAVATLLYLHSVEEAYHRQNARYGTLHDLVASRLLVLDVPVADAGFRRERYGFRLTLSPDGYRAEAVPQAPIGRSFMVDDSGIVRLPDE
jgi:serine/threonine protein kinase